jgi:hypothetical protein
LIIKLIPYVMKNIGLVLISIGLTLMLSMSCQSNKPIKEADPVITEKLKGYATFPLTADLSGLSEKEKQILPYLIQTAEIMDEIFWQETYGDKAELFEKYKDPSVQQFLQINYGPWERLNEDKPFIEGIGPKPTGAQFYPSDMTQDEFNAFESKDKASLYTMVRRDRGGNLYTIPYHEYFADQIKRASDLILKAAALSENEGLKNYLEARSAALLTDDYYASDVSWMSMKSSNIDFVVGPIENYEDALYGYKAAHEAFVLIKDLDWSSKLDRFAQLLPQLQKSLPVPDAYKQETPGSDSDLGVYQAVYYAGDCNSGSKTIAINLPNDERVQIEKGSRKLQLKNSMQAKFDKILVPIANELITEVQKKHVVFNAFFENVMFHEVAHGLGIKNTLGGKGVVRQVLGDQYSAIEEAKADVLGLYLVSQLAGMGELGEKDLMDNFVTYIAGLFRSVRFGASSAHGKANMLQFNYFKEAGAFTRDETTGTYTINFEPMKAAVSSLAGTILTLQGDGNYEGVKNLLSEKGIIVPELQRDLDRVNSKGIPKDIVFEQGLKVLGL